MENANASRRQCLDQAQVPFQMLHTQNLCFSGHTALGTVNSVIGTDAAHRALAIRDVRLDTTDCIMDTLENHLALVELVVEKKGNTSKRRLAAAFAQKTGRKVSETTLIRALKALKASELRESLFEYLDGYFDQI